MEQHLSTPNAKSETINLQQTVSIQNHDSDLSAKLKKKSTDTSKDIKTPDCLKDDYQFIRLLGEGANGKTFLAVSTTERKLVAIKELKLVDQFKSIELFEREAYTLANVNVEGVPKFYGFVTSKNNLGDCYIIQEFFDFPSLQDIIDHNKESNKAFSEEETYLIICGLANILDSLQSHYSPPIIHRDIKPSNILYDSKTQSVMLIDFGAVANPAKKSAGSTVAGTLGFMAPEQMMGECTVQSDYYAVGATALYMLTSVSPVDIENDPSNPFLLNSAPLMTERGVSDNMQRFIQDLMCPQIEERPRNVQDLLEQIDKLGKLCYQGNLGTRNRITRKRHQTFNALWNGLVIVLMISLGLIIGLATLLFTGSVGLGITAGIASSVILSFQAIGKTFKETKIYTKALNDILHVFEPLPADAKLSKTERIHPMHIYGIVQDKKESYVECIYMRNGEYFFYYGDVKPGDRLLLREASEGKISDAVYEVKSS